MLEGPRVGYSDCSNRLNRPPRALTFVRRPCRSLVAARMVQNLICAVFALWAPWPHMEVFKDAALAPRERWIPEDACANMW